MNQPSVMEPASVNPSRNQSPNKRKKSRFSRTADQNVSQVLDQFHPFPRLSIELREMIWKYAMGPRFITWLDKQLLPSVLHACFESRSLWLKHHKIEHWKSSLFDRETMFIDYSSDIMHFNREIPGMHGWTEFPKLITDLKTGWLRHGAWLKEVERLAVSYESAMKEFDVPPMRFYRDPDPGSRWKKLSAWCPKLKELIVVLGADGQGDIGDKEWMEIGKVVLPIEPWCWRWDTPNFRVDSFKAGRLAKLRNIEVKFVKVKNTA